MCIDPGVFLSLYAFARLSLKKCKHTSLCMSVRMCDYVCVCTSCSSLLHHRFQFHTCLESTKNQFSFRTCFCLKITDHIPRNPRDGPLKLGPWTAYMAYLPWLQWRAFCRFYAAWVLWPCWHVSRGCTRVDDSLQKSWPVWCCNSYPSLRNACNAR